jgi:lipoprotein-anchoring transpeptidase ErfK/SrfK
MNGIATRVSVPILLGLSAVFFVPSAYADAGTYAEVIKGCTNLAGRCVNIRLGPGTTFATIKKARIGTVLEIDGQVEAGGYLWYRVKKDSFIRYPERATGTWYIASHLVRVTTEPGVEVAKAPRKNGKSIVVDISAQRLYAYNNGKVFMNTAVSTGIIKTPTPKGSFYIFKKQPSRYMQGPLPGISGKVYDLPGVPWTMYFTQQGAAIHGTYWHANFGKPSSNGCVNLPVYKAKQLYDWADVGTRVYVQK